MRGHYQCSCGRIYEEEMEAMCCSICEEAGLMPRAGELTSHDLMEIDGVSLEEDNEEEAR